MQHVNTPTVSGSAGAAVRAAKAVSCTVGQGRSGHEQQRPWPGSLGTLVVPLARHKLRAPALSSRETASANNKSTAEELWLPP